MSFAPTRMGNGGFAAARARVPERRWAARDSWKAESVRVFADQIVRASTALESQSQKKEKKSADRANYADCARTQQ